MRYFKVALSVALVLLVSFFVVKSCVHPKKLMSTQEAQPGTSFKHMVIAPPPAAKIPPHIAIILDDWGKNYAVLKNAIDIRRPLTLSILPNLVHSRQIAEEAHQSGLGVMLHLPMEPFNKKEILEPHTIKTSMPENEIIQCVDDAVLAIPHVEGVNNHMGSAATSDARVMRTVLSRLLSKNLFFVDSHVTSLTKGPQVAHELGIRFAERDVFIDNVNQVDAIKKQLEKAKRIALTHGEAIVIGHDRKKTLQAIQEMLPEFDQAGVKLVLARDVVKPLK